MERIVYAYPDLAEDRTRRHIPMTMEDWTKRLDIFLQADEREVLTGGGRISAQIAKEDTENEFEKYKIIQDKLFESDFDKQLKLLNNRYQKQRTAITPFLLPAVRLLYGVSISPAAIPF